MPDMAERIYQHYLDHPGRAKKKLTRKQFRKRYNSRLKKRSPGTQRIRRGIGGNMSEKDFQKFGPK